MNSIGKYIFLFFEWLAKMIVDVREANVENSILKEVQREQFRREVENKDVLQKINTNDLSESDVGELLSGKKQRAADDKSKSSPRTSFRKG